ncbi:MAG: hypothetical protein IPL65_07830 [Lewinellaceae bacterium]|nr:hypothetical protein [Lewinellaceae bacterium]
MEHYPLVLNNITPLYHNGQHLLADAQQEALVVADADAWRLLALSGGRPLTVFGVWNGKTMSIVSLVQEKRLRLL